MRHCLLVLFAVAPALHAAQVCDVQPCRINLDFANGGSISSSGGATITFGEGGALALGADGTITPGQGGSVIPAAGEGGSPDMSNGGSVVLGPGGSILFGAEGSLATGSAGGIAFPEGSDLSASGAQAVSIDSDGSVRLGSLASSGSVSLTAAGTVDTPGAIAANLSMASDDTTTSILVNSGGDVSYASISAPVTNIDEGAAATTSGGYTQVSGAAISTLSAPPAAGAFGWAQMMLFPIAVWRLARPVRRRP